ncbi:MAG: beta-phosphoglucomutase, partial [Flavobacteriales bacterium]|nr:beta-phosphoglucomutase [Flavobacteriales bacterium]
MVKGLIFDLDGVIVSTELNHYLAWKKIADKFDIPFNEVANEQLKGLSREDSLLKLLEIVNLSFEETYFNELLTIKNEHYLNSLESLSLKNILPGVLMLLNSAKERGVFMSVGSSSKNAAFILDKLGLTDYFDIIVDGNGVKYPKPHPEVFLNAAKGMCLQAIDCVVFED